MGQGCTCLPKLPFVYALGSIPCAQSSIVEQISERVLLEKSVGDECVMGLVTSVDCQSVSKMKRSRHGDLMEQARAEVEKACRGPEIAAA